MRQEVDWFRVITDLQRAGMSHSQQAKEIEVATRTIGYWKMGGEPPYSKGIKLLDVYRTVVGST